MPSNRHPQGAEVATRQRPGRRPGRPAAKKGPDLAAVAREAVVSFLHDAQAAGEGQPALADSTAEAVTVASGTAVTLRATATEMLAATGPGGLETTEGPGAETVAWQAAAVSVATLDRIEAAAAKLEADIAAAMAAQAQLHAAAGAAAEAAVRAAQSAAVSSRDAAQSERTAKVVLHKIERYLSITVALLVVAVIIMIITASPAG